MIEDLRSAPTRAAMIGLIGEGALHETTKSLLTGDHRVVSLGQQDLTGRIAELDMVLLVSDGWDQDLHTRLNAACIDQGVPLLPAYVEPGSAIIGPAVLPGEPGCLVCARARRLRARTDATDYARLIEQFKAELASAGRAWLTKYATSLLGGLVAEEVRAILGDRESMKTRGGFIRLKLDGLRPSVHRFLPDPLCEFCGRLPEDSREGARIEPQARPKVSPGSYRVRSLGGEREKLLGLYVDEEAGMIRALYKEGRNIFPSTSAPVGLRGSRRTQVGYGHQLDHASSQLTAITEALERYGGIQPGGKRTVVRASYSQLGDDALDPTALGLHADEQYDLPGFPYIRYHHDLTFNWVWGYSFRQRRPILVPENYAYYGTVFEETHDRPFVYEISNGCALGGCLEEAILYGILEVAERDAFLLTWYARLPVPRIDPATARDRSIPLIIENIEHATGYKLDVFNISLGQRIPCFWVMAVDQRGRADLPKALCAAGSHLDPEKALTNTLLELAPMLSRPAQYYRQHSQRVQEMLRNPYAVAAMEDHALLNGAPEAFERFAFLYKSDSLQSFDEAFAFHYEAPAHADLLDDLNERVDDYLKQGLDVVVVDQTTPEQRAGGFSCVKVIIPGTLPMTFGHQARRNTGFERLYRIPYELGYSGRRLTQADINPYPHPFP